MLAQNAKLREDIQHLRNQRGIFDTIHKRLCKNLVGKKREQVRLESSHLTVKDTGFISALKRGKSLSKV